MNPPVACWLRLITPIHRINALASMIAIFIFPLLTLLAPPAHAQFSQLTCDIVGQTDLLTDSQRQIIRDHASAAVQNAADADQDIRQRGFASLMQPFACNSVSSTFRLEYSRALNDSLTAWAGGDDARLAWVAMLVAGRCGTDLVEGVLSTGLRDQRPAVRGAAGVGIRDAVAGLVAEQDGLRSERASVLIQAAFRQLAAETDPIVAEQLASIGGAISGSPALFRQHFADYANSVAASVQTARQAANLAPNPEATTQPQLISADRRDRLVILERALNLVRFGLVQPRVGPELRNSDVAAAGLLAGQALAFVRDELAADRIDAARLPSAILIVERAAELLQITGDRLAVSRPQANARSMADALRSGAESGDPEPFAQIVQAWIGPGGGLVGGTFGGRAEAFAPAP
ncbi:MAG: hypothetical protein ACTS3F_09730 [Phycisphaerales bacterium]